MILLDTNVAYWSLVADEKIGAGARSHMMASSCFVSALTIVELRVKEMKGKLHIPTGLLDHLSRLGFLTMPFTAADADALPQFPSLTNHDPFDRMLLAQARVNSMEFITADQKLIALEQPWIIDATQ